MWSSWYSYAILFQRLETHVRMASQNINKRVKTVLPSRSQQLQRLKEDEFDVLVVGGGATGSGCALDAATRGLKTGEKIL